MFILKWWKKRRAKKQFEETQQLMQILQNRPCPDHLRDSQILYMRQLNRRLSELAKECNE